MKKWVGGRGGLGVGGGGGERGGKVVGVRGYAETLPS